MINVFPKIPPPPLAQALHLADQIDAHARRPGPEQQAVQARQVEALLRHARAHSPFWRARIDAIASADGALRFDALAPLTRAELQSRFEDLRARTPEIAPRDLHVARTSGSTGRPVEVEQWRPMYDPLYRAITLLEERWSGRPADATLAILRDTPDRPPETIEHWDGTRRLRLVRNMIAHAPQDLLAWLRASRPSDLLTTPAMVQRLAELAIADSAARPAIARVYTFGEVVTPELRARAREAFGARVVDRYTCEELGWIALQCPRHDHLHVLSSNVLLEVVDDEGRPCPPGVAGRVLLTGLHSFAMPLIRYDIGDVAEPGGACDCGLHLPVLRRVLGRERGFLRMPDGRLRLARLTGEHWRTVAPVDEYRVLQYADGLVEAFVTAPRPLAGAERDALAAMLRHTLDPGLAVLVTQCDSLAPLSRWKRIDVLRLDRLRGEDDSPAAIAATLGASPT